ncbi:hypothetical protein ACFWDA_04750 [Rhodococcus zopfii]|uniref:Uncharacterized protein n=1 Tax=Rhodococcus zopfii TaxID=43772 RepID=A0ABU3WQE9_9NOCA|nr:hypothetical protein [Rhodococcus zopfii]MDV2476215.1 hypothetical protein [Rhodococcus zopfii]
MRDILKVDLDRLEVLAGELGTLAKDAAALTVGPAAGPHAAGPGGIMPSVLAASRMSTDLLDAALVPAVTERFEETSNVIRSSIEAYRNREDDAVAELAAAYLSSTGDWTTETGA